MQWSFTAAKSALDSFNLSPLSRSVADSWLSLWDHDAPPVRARFNPDKFRNELPGIAIFDVQPRKSVTCRFAGVAYKFRFGCDIAGRDWLAMTRPEDRSKRLERNTAIVLGSVSHGRRRDLNRVDDAWFSDVQLPFGDSAPDGTRSYLHHSDWRPRDGELRLSRTRAAAPAAAEEFFLVRIGSAIDGADGATSRSCEQAVRVGGASRRGSPSPAPDACTHQGIAVTDDGSENADSTGDDASSLELPKFSGETVLVVDDDPAILELMALQLVAAGLNPIPLSSAKAVLEHSFADIRCLISDVRMPDMDGLSLQAELNRRQVGVPFIVVTAHGDIPLAVRAMRAGAVDVIEKPIRPGRLTLAIKRALSLGDEMDAEETAAHEARELLAGLTAREKEVFDLVAAGESSKEIARQLEISGRTVDIHRGHLMRKLGLRNVAELVRLAIAMK